MLSPGLVIVGAALADSKPQGRHEDQELPAVHAS